MGLEPTTFRVHCTHYFHNGVDYIFTSRQLPLGVPVSSLYGALYPFVFLIQVPSVFAYGSLCEPRSLHRYPGKFQPAFRTGSCTSTGGRSNQLSYTRIRNVRIARSNILRLRNKYIRAGALLYIKRHNATLSFLLNTSS